MIEAAKYRKKAPARGKEAMREKKKKKTDANYNLLFPKM